MNIFSPGHSRYKNWLKQSWLSGNDKPCIGCLVCYCIVGNLASINFGEMAKYKRKFHFGEILAWWFWYDVRTHGSLASSVSCNQCWGSKLCWNLSCFQENLNSENDCMELATYGTNNIMGLCSAAVTCRNTLNLLPATEAITVCMYIQGYKSSFLQLPPWHLSVCVHK